MRVHTKSGLVPNVLRKLGELGEKNLIDDNGGRIGRFGMNFLILVFCVFYSLPCCLLPVACCLFPNGDKLKGGA